MAGSRLAVQSSLIAQLPVGCFQMQQSHEYKLYNKTEAALPRRGGEGAPSLFHFKPVSLTDDFWASHRSCPFLSFYL